MEKRSKGTNDIISSLTVAVIFIVILLLVVFAASSYRNGSEHQSASDNERAVLSYVITAVKDSNGGKVEVKDLDGCPGIVIEDKGTDYEQKIYLKDGKLLQEYSEKGAAPQPDEALEIGETDVFEASFVSDTVLRVETDKGTSYVDTEI